MKRHDYRRFWDLAKLAHIVMGRIEGIRACIEKNGDMSSAVAVAYGSAHGHASDLVRFALQNVFLQDMKINERQIAYWKEKGLLDGALRHTFEQMRLDPPKEYSPPAST
jgi:hypothetical protein